MTDRLLKSCQTCAHNKVCKYTDEELCNGIKVKDLITECKDYTESVTVNEWISVEDRLPDDKTAVLVYCKKGNVHRHIGYTRGIDEGWFTFSTDESIHDVTHWMPLPQPPKEAE